MIENNKIDIVDSGDLRKYYTIIPNIIIDMELDQYSFRLYAVLKRIAGEKGRCWKSVKNLSAISNMSVGKVTAAKKILIKNNLISVTKRMKTDETHDTDLITIVDVWVDNMGKYSKNTTKSMPSCGDVPHEMNDVPHRTESINNSHIKNQLPEFSKKIEGNDNEWQDEVPNTSIQVKEEEELPEDKKKESDQLSNKKKRKTRALKIEKDNPSLYPLAKAIAEVTYTNFENNKPKLFQLAKQLQNNNNATSEQVYKQFGSGGYWYNDKFNKSVNRKPTIQNIREKWGMLVDDPMKPIEIQGSGFEYLLTQ
jgi:hypothetical protein